MSLVRNSFVKLCFYRTVQYLARFFGVTLFQLRCYGREHTNFDGPALILSTHQSHFDPVLIGATFNERLNYLARKTLFNSRIFATVITLLDAIELDRDRSGIAGLKETIKRLKSGSKVLIFPEGTRSTDGKIGELKPGFLAVARRCQVPLLPVAITGAYEALPKGTKFPRNVPLRVAIGPRVEFSEYSELSDDETLSLLSQRLKECYEIAKGAA
ncbi:MAG: 1-acyl-sn-glycerol-3-phosphate acyltransferase [Planctomycetales bacterium]|nr:1-acyl-sn-glycerol-3-phosphate acyltransferase [Planctomycetales bacterium]